MQDDLAHTGRNLCPSLKLDFQETALQAKSEKSHGVTRN